MILIIQTFWKLENLNTVKFGKLKDDNNYVSGNDGGNFQEKILKIFLKIESRMTHIMLIICHWKFNLKKKRKKWKNEKKD